MKDGEYYLGNFYQAREVVWLILSLSDRDFRELAMKHSNEKISVLQHRTIFVIQLHCYSMKGHSPNAKLMHTFST